ncbi:hypothetical protein NMY22_g11398 [Coprinellus aureogranulatus]|nr:hypothetical protein NMY22_g11398 [Coprinellus aureogranulatus]
MVHADEPINSAETTLSPDFCSDIAVFKVENTIFRVLRKGLANASPLFETLFLLPGVNGESEGQTNDHPIVLESYKACDFDALMRVVYPRSNDLIAGGVTLTKDQWVGVLRLSTIWEMKGIRNFAITKLSSEEMALTPVEKVTLARDHKIAPWLVEGLKSLTSDTELSPDALEEVVGLRTAFQLTAVRLKLATIASQFTTVRQPQGNWAGVRIRDICQNCCYKPFVKDKTITCMSCSKSLQTDQAGVIYIKAQPSLRATYWDTHFCLKFSDLFCSSCDSQFITGATTCQNCGKTHLNFDTLLIYLGFHSSTARGVSVQTDALIQETFKEEIHEYLSFST